MLRLSSFDYDLPKDLIAQYPLRKRDLANLLVLRRDKGTITHCSFREIKDFLSPDELLVLNDTKVLPCRLLGRRITGGKVEVLLLKQKRGLNFDALIKPGRLKVGEKIIFDGSNLLGEIISKNEIAFAAKDIDVVYKAGVMPLPPYIKRQPQGMDEFYYQTVYAKKEGAVAAPTAGLHFTRQLIQEVKQKKVNIAYITLHVGQGTFKPVKADDITKHKMEPEYFVVSESASGLIEKARLSKKRIFAVGTTSLRALETYAMGTKAGLTDLFIYPGYKFRIANCLLTNFHLPRTTLFMLVCAFAGTELIKKAYQEAIDRKYRFYSYGDAMLII